MTVNIPVKVMITDIIKLNSNLKAKSLDIHVIGN